MDSESRKTGLKFIQSEELKTNVPFCVHVPEDDSSEEFPVIFSLHGLMRWEGDFDPSPTEKDFFEKQLSHSDKVELINNIPVSSNQDLANAVKAVIVTVNGGSSWYMDSPLRDGCNFESYFIKELIPYVNKNYPVIDDRAFRALIGHSMGGGGALRFILKYPELFDTVGIRSAAMHFYSDDLEPNRFLADILGPLEKNRELWKRECPLNMLENLLESNRKNIYISFGLKDGKAILYGNLILHSFLLMNRIDHIYRETEDGHECSPYMNEILLWAAETMNQKRMKE